MSSLAKGIFILLVVLGVLALIVGATALAVDPPEKSRREWDPMGLIQTGLGLCVAASLQVLLARRLETGKSDRELIEKEVDRACDRLTDSLAAFEEAVEHPDSLRKVISATKRLGMSISVVCEMLRQLSEHDRDDLRAELESDLRSVRKMLTGKDRPEEADLGGAELAAQALRLQLFKTTRTIAKW